MGLGDLRDGLELVAEPLVARLDVVEPRGPRVEAVAERVGLAEDEERLPGDPVVVLVAVRRRRGRGPVREDEARREEARAAARVAVDVAREGLVGAPELAPRVVVGLLDDVVTLAKLAATKRASLVVTDFTPLKPNDAWVAAATKSLAGRAPTP